MSERKVLNKHFPPDFDPARMPRLELPKDLQHVVKLMAPFNMSCKTCGEDIYKGKKFNARKETARKEAYLGLPIFRFCVRCTRCLAEITFKTEPQSTDYTTEHGATRNCQAEKLLEEEEKRMQKEREEEELSNPMKVLENRTKHSKLEMEVLENLQELKELNQRQASVDFEAMLKQHKELEEDEQEMKALLEQAQNRRLLVDSDSDEEPAKRCLNPTAQTKPTDILQEHPQSKRLRMESWGHSVGKLSTKARRKQKAEPALDKGMETQGTTASTSSLPAAAAATSSLGLLGAYSDSEDTASD
ncbi:YJU2 factor, partial [Prunella fulvescens]|nr:YJU2 factor [Prunella fulvescens]